MPPNTEAAAPPTLVRRPHAHRVFGNVLEKRHPFFRSQAPLPLQTLRFGVNHCPAVSALSEAAVAITSTDTVQQPTRNSPSDWVCHSPMALVGHLETRTSFLTVCSHQQLTQHPGSTLGTAHTSHYPCSCTSSCLGQRQQWQVSRTRVSLRRSQPARLQSWAGTGPPGPRQGA